MRCRRERGRGSKSEVSRAHSAVGNHFCTIFCTLRFPFCCASTTYNGKLHHRFPERGDSSPLSPLADSSASAGANFGHWTLDIGPLCPVWYGFSDRGSELGIYHWHA